MNGVRELSLAQLKLRSISILFDGMHTVYLLIASEFLRRLPWCFINHMAKLQGSTVEMQQDITLLNYAHDQDMFYTLNIVVILKTSSLPLPRKALPQILILALRIIQAIPLLL
jgi:hypothetical protein